MLKAKARGPPAATSVIIAAPRVVRMPEPMPWKNLERIRCVGVRDSPERAEPIVNNTNP